MRKAMLPYLLPALCGMLFCSTSAQAELTKADKKAIKKMLKQDVLYMRMDAPCVSGRHDFGTFYRPLVEISPEDADTASAPEINVGFFHTASMYRGIRINDPVEFDEMDIEKDEATVEIELDGVDEADGDKTVIKMVQIHSLADFERAFDLAFSRRPLQELHDDWPDDIKKAIGKRRLMNGMTKRQAFYITGTPETIDRSEENGIELETWTLTVTKGMKTGFFLMRQKRRQGIPSSIRFKDGKLIGIGTAAPGDLDLDS